MPKPMIICAPEQYEFSPPAEFQLAGGGAGSQARPASGTFASAKKVAFQLSEIKNKFFEKSAKALFRFTVGKENWCPFNRRRREL